MRDTELHNRLSALSASRPTRSLFPIRDGLACILRMAHRDGMASAAMQRVSWAADSRTESSEQSSERERRA